MNSHPDKENGGDLRAAVEDLTTRLKRVEEQLGIASLPTSIAERKVEPVLDNVLPKQDNEPERESLEFEVGQTWFALIGIVALARKLLVELWRYLQTGALPEGAVTKS